MNANWNVFVKGASSPSLGLPASHMRKGNRRRLASHMTGIQANRSRRVWSLGSYSMGTQRSPRVFLGEKKNHARPFDLALAFKLGNL